MNAGIKGWAINLETRCINAKNFKDLNSYNPKLNDQIDLERGADEHYHCPLPVKDFVKRGKMRLKHPYCRVSYSGGKYLCNYI